MRADGGADKDTVMLHDDASFNTEGFKAVKGLGDRAWTNGMAMAANGLKDRGAHNYAYALAVAKTVEKRM